MEDETLSQEEVVSLLHGADAQSRSGGRALGRPQATPYDFKKPERVGKDQIQVLQSLHEGLARNFGAALSGLLRCLVEVKLASVEQLPYSEFVFSLENPTCFNVLRADPLEGRLILDINPSILYPVIDRLLGGGKESGPPARRPLTEIELRLVSRITRLFLGELKHAWQSVVDLELTIERVESNPQLVQVVSPNEAVILVIFELTIGEMRGIMNFCIPFTAIERITGKLQANSWAASLARAKPTEQSRQQVGVRLKRAQVEVVVTLADTKITTAELLNLRVGDVITTEKDMRSLLEVAVEGATKFHAQPGAFKGRKAIQVQSASG